MKAVLVHYGELALKGKNRKDFEERLVRNIKLAIGKGVLKQVNRLEGRMVLFPNSQNKKTEALITERLSKVLGLSWFSFADVCAPDVGKIKSSVLKAGKGKLDKKKTFKVDTTRAYKKFPHNSMEMNGMLGEALIEKFKPNVSLDNPDVTVFVEITKDWAFVYTDKVRCSNGLPVGSSGRVLVLLSGGIDSPVAAWLMMKRGCSVDYLHIHAMRESKDLENTKIREILEKLHEYDPRSKLYAVPYHEFDIRAQGAPSEYNLILFRRFMLRVAERLAKEIKVSAIVTGDNLAQVASQTLESITVADEAVDIPIFRPLLAYNKEDTINLARKIGTYELSIKPYKDCCSIVAKHPTTKPKLDKTKKFESKIKIDSIVRKCFKSVAVV